MNYYEHHLGDYAKDTAHLTMIEHGAYRLLLDRYYGTESGIPEDQVHRVARARSKEEKAAVDVVLQEFFYLDGGVWKNKRAEQEIEKFLAGKPKADERREGDKERQRRARERRKALFQELSRLGVHMPFESTTDELYNAIIQAKSRPSHNNVTQPVTRDNTATQTPDTSHQSPNISKNNNNTCELENTAAKKNELLPSPPRSAQQIRSIEIAVLLRQRGAALTHSDPRVIDWATTGVTDTQLLQALDTAKAQREEQGNPSPINAGYLDSILNSKKRKALGNARGHDRPLTQAEKRSQVAAFQFRNLPEYQNHANEPSVIDITPANEP